MDVTTQMGLKASEGSNEKSHAALAAEHEPKANAQRKRKHCCNLEFYILGGNVVSSPCQGENAGDYCNHRCLVRGCSTEKAMRLHCLCATTRTKRGQRKRCNTSHRLEGEE
mmetsp:Transcript_48059/g.65197  ORF Transcript_48059/g.65197 Transcript_48059/m.65197 type:complete len:111 (+) Transcript_48059:214-546(+)